MSQGGLAIFHIDENANNIRGFPGQVGPDQIVWPNNGNHYKIALLQADGNYNLEHNNNRGDSGDLFHAGGVNSIGPDGTSAGNAFPNTNAYQYGNIMDSLVTISNISAAGSTMTFDVQWGTAAPSPAPTVCNDLHAQLYVKSDYYPGEISWVIQDESGTIVKSDEGEITSVWTEYSKDMCLEPAVCYTFTIYDQYADGIEDPGTFSLTVDSVETLSKPSAGIYDSLSVSFGECGSSFCGDNICDINAGEGCGSCPSDCFQDSHCNAISYSNAPLYYNPESYGVVFDVSVASRSLYLYELVVYILQTTTAKVYMKNGSYADESNLQIWTKVFDGDVLPGTETSIKFDSRFYASADSTVAIYISYGSPGKFVFTTGGEASNVDAAIRTGMLLREQTDETLPPLYSSTSGAVDFMRSIKYDYAPEVEQSLSPSTIPTAIPTAIPSTTPSTTPSTIPTFRCVDRTDEWQIGKRTKQWCRWAQKLGPEYTYNRCAHKNLFDDCPVTCGVCTP